jgi:Flp pilus assembly protein TadB
MKGSLMSTTSAIFDDFQLFRVIALILLVTGIATASFPVLIAAGIVTFGWPFLCVYLLKSAAGRKNRRENISFRLFDLVRRAASVLPIPSRIVR